MAWCAEFAPRVPCGRFVIFPPGNARARQSDASAALTSSSDPDMRTAAAHGHTHTRQGKIQVYAWQQLHAAEIGF